MKCMRCVCVCVNVSLRSPYLKKKKKASMAPETHKFNEKKTKTADP